LSLFYYLRIGLVMFFEDQNKGSLDDVGTPLRIAIAVCALLTIALGIGPLSQVALDLVGEAALDLLSS
jgi:NADH:ubiquinone oxidoreductase subunit 2 (subunit N)